MKVHILQDQICWHFSTANFCAFCRNRMGSFNRHNSTQWKQAHKTFPQYEKIRWKNSGLLYCWSASDPMNFLPFTVGSCIVFLADTTHASTFSVTGDSEAGISIARIVRIPGNDKHLGMFLCYSMEVCQCELWFLVVQFWMGVKFFT